jgi:hypothetical protein
MTARRHSIRVQTELPRRAARPDHSVEPDEKRGAEDHDANPGMRRSRQPRDVPLTVLRPVANPLYRPAIAVRHTEPMGRDVLARVTSAKGDSGGASS